MQMIASHVTEEDVLNYLLQHAVNKCFQLLQAMELTSIAFPALGAGALYTNQEGDRTNVDSHCSQFGQHQQES